MIVGIFGTSYSGSTILSFILGGHPNIFSVGETTSFKRRGGGVKCTMCDFKGLSCDFWSQDFIDKCATDVYRCYPLIENRARDMLGKNMILLSDKTVAHYSKQSAKPDMAIIIFKSPQAFYFSYTRHRSLRGKYDEPADVCDIYVNHYKNDIKYLNENNIPYTVVSYDDLCQDTSRVVQHLIMFTENDTAENIEQYWKHDLHILEGNAGPYMSALPSKMADAAAKSSSLTTTGRTHEDYYDGNHHGLKVDDRWKEQLFPFELEDIGNHKNSNKMYNKLLDMREYI